MHSRRRDQDGLALLTNAGSLLGDYAQRLCALRTAKRYPASFGGRQGSHSALRDKPVVVVHGLPRACGRSQGCRANRHSLAGAFASHYPKQTALARSRLYRLFEWSAGVTYDIPRQRMLEAPSTLSNPANVDDAMTTVDVMTSRLAAGDSKEQSAIFAYKTLAFPMLTGSFVTAAGFVPIGFARSAAGEYTFSIFAVVTIALIVSWFVAVLFAPLLGVWLLKKPETAAPEQQGAVVRIFRTILIGAMRMRWLTIALTLACFVASLLALPYVPRQFFPASDRPELVVDLTLPQTPRSSPAIRSRPRP
jgi:AcrB/AcrD/AcrF family